MIALALALLLAGGAPTAAPGPASVEQAADPDYRRADWAYVPPAEDMLRVYPKAARKAGMPGSAVIFCRVTAKGRLEACAVVEESSEGFGQAALDFAPTVRMRPATRGGVAIEDSIRIPLMWNPPPF